MRYVSGLPDKKKPLDLPQLALLEQMLICSKTLSTNVGLAKQGLGEIAQICNRILSLEAEIESKVRSSRTMKQDMGILSIEEATAQVSMLIAKDLPRALATLSSFVGVKLALTANITDTLIKDLMSSPHDDI